MFPRTFHQEFSRIKWSGTRVTSGFISHPSSDRNQSECVTIWNETFSPLWPAVIVNRFRFKLSLIKWSLLVGSAHQFPFHCLSAGDFNLLMTSLCYSSYKSAGAPVPTGLQDVPPTQQHAYRDEDFPEGLTVSGDPGGCTSRPIREPHQWEPNLGRDSGD